jgi:hypothetical protein
MIKWLIEIFTPTPNDWTLIEVIQGEWTVTNRSYGESHKTTETAVYEIYYSQSKNEYKLEILGYKAKEHNKYVVVVARLNELKNGNKQD